MATRQASSLNKPRCHDAGLVYVDGVIKGNNANAPTVHQGKGFTVARTALGKFTITSVDRFYAVQSAMVNIAKGTPDGLKYISQGLPVIASNLVSVPVEVRRARGFAASMTITCTAKANYVDHEDMLQLVDEYGDNQELYEADPAGDGVPSGIAVDISGDTSAIEVAATLAALIVTNSPWLTVVDNLDGTITLTHKRRDAFGNLVAGTENVADAGHIVPANFTGGLDNGELVDPTTDEYFQFFLSGKRYGGSRI